jgi:hypothetical protein
MREILNNLTNLLKIFTNWCHKKLNTMSFPTYPPKGRIFPEMKFLQTSMRLQMICNQCLSFQINRLFRLHLQEVFVKTMKKSWQQKRTAANRPCQKKLRQITVANNGVIQFKLKANSRKKI